MTVRSTGAATRANGPFFQIGTSPMSNQVIVIRADYRSGPTGRRLYTDSLCASLSEAGFAVEAIWLTVNNTCETLWRFLRGAPISLARIDSSRNRAAVASYLGSRSSSIAMVDGLGAAQLLIDVSPNTRLYYASQNAEGEVARTESGLRRWANASREEDLEALVCKHAIAVSCISARDRDSIQQLGVQPIVIPPLNEQNPYGVDGHDSALPPTLTIYSSASWRRKRVGIGRFLAEHFATLQQICSQTDVQLMGSMSDNSQADFIRIAPFLHIHANAADPVSKITGGDVVLPESDFPGFPMRILEVARAGALLIADSSLEARTDLRSGNHFIEVEHYMRSSCSVDPATRSQIIRQLRAHVATHFGPLRRQAAIDKLGDQLTR